MNISEDDKKILEDCLVEIQEDESKKLNLNDKNDVKKMIKFIY